MRRQAARSVQLLLSLCLLVYPCSPALADRAEDLLGVEPEQRPVRRAIDQRLDNAGAKGGKGAGESLPGLLSPLPGSGALVSVYKLVETINKNLGTELQTTDAMASAPGGGAGDGRFGKKIAGVYPRPGTIREDDIPRNPKESMLHLLKSVNDKLASLFSELGLPSQHEVLKRAKLKLAAAQRAVHASVPDVDADARKKHKIGKPILGVNAGGQAHASFKKRTKSAVVDRLHDPKVHIPGEPGTGVSKAGPTLSKVQLAKLTTAGLHPNIDESKLDSLKQDYTQKDPATGLPPGIDKSLSPKIDKIDQVRESVSKDIGKVGKKIPALDGLRPDVSQPAIDKPVVDHPSVDEDGIKKKVSQSIGKVNESVKKIDENIDESVDAIDEKVDKISENPGVDVDGIEKKVEDATSGIEKKVKQDVDGIQKKVEESVDEGGLKQKIENQLADRVNPDLEKVRKKVVAATNQAYGGVKKYLNGEISKQKTALIKKYRYRWWDGIVGDGDAEDWWGSEPNNWPNWIGDDSGDLKTYKKYYQGRGKVEGDQVSSVNSINLKFANVESLLAGGSIPTSGGGGADDGPDAPRSQQQRNPGSGRDHNVIEIRGSVSENLIIPLEVVASIGDRSTAVLDVATIGEVSDTSIGSARESVTAPGVITAAVGYETDAMLNIATVDGMVAGKVERTVIAPGLVVAAIGANSNARSNIAFVRGNVKGNVEQNVTVPTSVVASIGDRTKAEMHVGALYEGASVGSLKQDIKLRSPAINAAVGYKSTALTTIGNIHANVVGDVDQSISVGGIVNAAVGSHTHTSIAIGNVTKNIGGHLKQNIHVGEILNATVGAGTSVEVDVGSITAPVTGNVDMNISTGDLTSISVGAHTLTQTVVGAIRAPVYGNVTSRIRSGDITNLALGIGVGSGTSISARTFVGSIFTPVHGNTTIDISHGNIFTFGFGIDIDLGPLGELKIVIDGCNGGGTSIGNIGGPC